MRRTIANCIFGLLVVVSNYAQLPTDAGNVSVTRIRKVNKSVVLKNKAAIEITLSGSFYVGNLYYCLYIEGARIIPAGETNDNRSLVFVMSTDDWKKLKSGAPLWLTWGCRQPSAYKSIRPNASLNKRMLGK